MTDRELMQQALEALLEVNYDQAYAKEVAALRERLAQPEMEPCAGRNCGSTNPNLHSAECFEDYEKSTGMNQWQGLTDEEKIELWNKHENHWRFEDNLMAFTRAIEAKLREKNT